MKHYHIIITTDGAARGNPGPGGWAALLQTEGHEKLLIGEEPSQTTNNQMELFAVIAGFEALKKPSRVTLRCDSTYVITGLNRLLAGQPAPPGHGGLWVRLEQARAPHEVDVEWVKGHAGDPRSERVDQAANAAAARAYAQRESEQRNVQESEWTIFLCSPAAHGRRPVCWSVLAGDDDAYGEVDVGAMTEPTAMYHGLVQALEAATRFPAPAEHSLRIITNLELLVKQGRGEWRVKKPEHQALATRAASLCKHFQGVVYEFGVTDEILEHIHET